MKAAGSRGTTRANVVLTLTRRAFYFDREECRTVLELLNKLAAFHNVEVRKMPDDDIR